MFFQTYEICSRTTRRFALVGDTYELYKYSSDIYREDFFFSIFHSRLVKHASFSIILGACQRQLKLKYGTNFDVLVT